MARIWIYFENRWTEYANRWQVGVRGSAQAQVTARFQAWAPGRLKMPLAETGETGSRRLRCRVGEGVSGVQF